MSAAAMSALFISTQGFVCSLGCDGGVIVGFTGGTMGGVFGLGFSVVAV